MVILSKIPKKYVKNTKVKYPYSEENREPTIFLRNNFESETIEKEFTMAKDTGDTVG